MKGPNQTSRPLTLQTTLSIPTMATIIFFSHFRGNDLSFPAKIERSKVRNRREQVERASTKMASKGIGPEAVGSFSFSPPGPVRSFTRPRSICFAARDELLPVPFFRAPFPRPFSMGSAATGREAAPRASRCFICLSALFITCNLALARARVISYWFSALPALPFLAPPPPASSSPPFSSLPPLVEPVTS